MGAAGAKLLSDARGLTGGKRTKLLMIGLDNAGKTTMMPAVRSEGFQSTFSRAGFAKTLDIGRGCDVISFTVWDLGGRQNVRALRRKFYHDIEAVIFVIDSADRRRFEEAEFELDSLLSEEQLEGLPLLVFANKQDLLIAKPPEEIAESLGLHWRRDRAWNIQASCATKREGLLEGLNWVTAAANGDKAGMAMWASPLSSPAPPDKARRRERSMSDEAGAPSEAETASTADPGEASLAEAVASAAHQGRSKSIQQDQD